ncbi:transposase [Metabacillus fastidiosus]|uniref:transposase n=1 Tax=Metabacillus fastidiosus TaxID=1458 RepID=UPI002DC01ADF|nr:transposase [Metabacillus fastidiosus]MEC2076117.1 transposase [Metabacillus fastidiosus]
MVQEAVEIGNKFLVARRHQLSPNLVHKWMKTFQENNDFSIGETVSSAEVKQLEEENYQLKKLLEEKI